MGKMVDQESFVSLHLEMFVSRIWECLLGRGVDNKTEGRDLTISSLEAKGMAFFKKQLVLSQLIIWITWITPNRRSCVAQK